MQQPQQSNAMNYSQITKPQSKKLNSLIDVVRKEDSLGSTNKATGNISVNTNLQVGQLNLGGKDFVSGPTTPGIGGSLGFLNLPDLPSTGLGSAGRVDSPLSESLAKGPSVMGKTG